MKKRIFSFLVVIMIAISVFLPLNVSAITFEPTDFGLTSESALLVNMDSDTIIYEKNPDKKLLPASLTKIMTAILAIEEVEDMNVLVEAQIAVFNEIYLMNPSTAGIMAFEEVRMIDLLYGLILPSGCEAGGIIATYLGDGDQQVFIDRMNEKAKELGAENTYFHDAHGLDDDYAYTTAYDMYLITKYALELPLFKEIATTKVYQMPATNKHANPRNIYHTNKMIQTNTNYYCDYVQGIKTGTTGVDTKNLVSIAEKDGYNYMAIVLGAPTHDANGEFQEGTYIDTQNLYDWAFDDVEVRTIVGIDDEICEVNVKMGKEKDYVIATPSEEVKMLMPTNIDMTSVEKIIVENDNIIAPVKKGDVVGSLTLKLKDEVLGEVDLLAIDDITQDPIAKLKYQIVQFFKMPVVQAILIVLLLLVIAYIVFAILYNRKKKKLKYKRKKSSNKRR